MGKKRIVSIGDHFGKLTVIKEVPIRSKSNTRKIICQCECGNIKSIALVSLTNDHTSSCGCIRINNKHTRKYANSYEAALNHIYQDYINAYDEENLLPFDYFSQIIFKNCHYCDKPPSNIKNNLYHKDGKLKSGFTQEWAENSIVIYNGVDRVDSNKGHIIDNCVPCCMTCNFAKNDLTIEEFCIHILKIKENLIDNCQYNILIGLQIENYLSLKTEDNINFVKKILERTGKNNRYYINSQGSLIKLVWGKHNDNGSSYSDGCSIEYFYILSQLVCHYCKSIPNNCSKKKYNGGLVKFIYNGLDRIDSNLNHAENNVVPCCQSCNIMKWEQTYPEFIDWVNRVYDNFIVKKQGKIIIDF